MLELIAFSNGYSKMCEITASNYKCNIIIKGGGGLIILSYDSNVIEILFSNLFFQQMRRKNYLSIGIKSTF